MAFSRKFNGLKKQNNIAMINVINTFLQFGNSRGYNCQTNIQVCLICPDNSFAYIPELHS